jgi:restriction endonuclease S subunit
VTRPYLRVANVLHGRLALETITEISVPRAVAERATLRAGDLLMTEGGDLDKLGRGTVWRDEIPGCLHQNHVFAVRVDPRRLDAEYLALLTQTAHARTYFERTGSQITNLASTSSTKVLDFPVPALPLERQRALVWEASTATATLADIGSRLTKQIDFLREHRQALITAAVTGQLDVAKTTA